MKSLHIGRVLAILIGLLVPSIVFFLMYAKRIEAREQAFQESAQSADSIIRKNPKYTKIDPLHVQTNAEKLIQFRNSSEIEERREDAVELIWGSLDGLSREKMPDRVEKDVLDYPFVRINAMESADRLIVKMENGVNSIVYLLHPRKKSSRLVILHGGHEEQINSVLILASSLLERNYTVMLISMPLNAQNARPLVEVPHFGKIYFTSHNQLFLLDHPLHYFFEPVLRSLNYAEKTLSPTRIDMTGISGGGWTTTVYAALDTRITGSYPIAGSLPHYLLTDINSSAWTEQELVYPPLFRLVSYPELYVMAAHGKDRRSVQILNQFDGCCFAGVGYQTYVGAVQSSVKKLGPGHFDVFLDSSSTVHEISGKAKDLILTQIEL